MPEQIRPRYQYSTCQDWGTVVPRDGSRPIPCPYNCKAAQKLAAKNADRPAR